MAPSKLRKALGAVKDQTSIGLAKVASSSELDVAIVKASKHCESFPADERHIRDVLALTQHHSSTSGASFQVGACVAALSRRLGRTRSWDVALKALVIVHRLLADGGPAFEQELFYATRRGTRMLNMSDFCDRSRRDAWDFSAFVRTYAAYLDDRLEYRMQARQGPNGSNRFCKLLKDELYSQSPGRPREEDADHGDQAGKAVALVLRDKPASEMTLEQLLAKVQQLQQLLDRFIACRPVGAARTNRVVTVSLYPLVKESAQLYLELTEARAALIERFPDMEAADDCERVHGVFCGLAKQIEELDAFYAWCKDAYVCRQSDVPEVEPVTHKKLELMDEFVRDRRAAELSQQTLLPPSYSPSPEPPSPEPEEPPAEEEEEHAMNATKALPPPVAVQREQEEVDLLPLLTTETVEEEADFLNLKADAMSGEEHGQQLALALFDGKPPTSELFDPSSSADWETALVESASALASQQAVLGGGLDMLVLDGMYSHATASTNAQAFSGSASSVTLRPPVAPMLLALPAPPGMCSGAAADPFAASMAVPPPAFVQMSDMQTKQRLLTEEQMAWQQYGKNGMQGQRGLAMLQPPQQRPQQFMPPSVCNYAAYHHPS
ncbi:putative clathrin assembly protein At1g03050 [Brachypodium distachyon]|uniref:ENTH domain-containing protein n=1 Tax=Brachypodium distachyon TaxID=15368 RepID=I1HJ78_BRADI|nr:putative clathrin assembly protein At1g03050 [Brachypodium distachyon]KQK06147.1 hypothetical protein BRADI_2g24800v3 [Brachypodium distachyon]|eukprot:XP_003566218.1 putative clathrin assembly protein At1g03050 [Brachypodium distachyon]